jgi:rod shape-determining protein MreD
MIKFLKIVLIVYAALLAEVTLLPAHVADPFKPNLLILAVATLGLREGGWHGGVLAFLLGLIADCFSGIYLGLTAFSFLCIYLVLRKVAGRLYTDNLYLMVLVVALATVANGVVQLLLLLMFSVAGGVYAVLLPSLIPQALVNALAASLVFGAQPFTLREDSR